MIKRTVVIEKFKESLVSVLPITVIVLLLCFTITPISSGTLLAFLFGAILLIVGMALFTLGADVAMSPMGEAVGAQMTKSKKLWLIIATCFFVGVLITISEPDLQVLASQVPMIPNMTLIITVGVGVGIFLVFALLRILFSIRLSYMLIVFYAIVFILAIFVPSDFLAVAFDSGGVTTGPMTVPFIMAMGVGIASIRSDKHAGNDSFGLVALSSVGPILAVMVLGLIFNTTDSTFVPVNVPEIGTSSELAQIFLHEFPTYFKEVAVALLPIVIFFLVFQAFTIKLGKRPIIRILVGVLYTYVGLVLFLTGVNVGFMPVGKLIGSLIAGLEYKWILVPIGMLIGYFIVSAEPAVHVLNKQVDEITSGTIPESAMNLCLSIGVCISVGLSMIRVLTGIHIMWLMVPGYLLAIILSFFCPKIFTSIAFDSGGVASGPMATTFLLPLAMGACEGVGGNVAVDAFGVVAMVAMMPLITVQIMGCVYKIKLKKQEAQTEETSVALPEVDTDIIELED